MEDHRSHKPLMSKRVIITGITGQDGSYLAELLLSKGYEVLAPSAAPAPNFWRIQHTDRLTKPATLDQLSLIRLVEQVRPDEFYNLAAMSFAPASWTSRSSPETSTRRARRAMETIRQVDKSIRVYQASSSEMFGKCARCRRTPRRSIRAVPTASRRFLPTTSP
jgi:GDPmannose 4,6-dehydratase